MANTIFPVVTVVLAVLLVPAQCFEAAITFPNINDYIGQISNIARVKRQMPNAKCLEDYKAFQTDDIQACNKIMAETRTDTVADANRFCANNCAKKLSDIYGKLVKDCGATPGLSPGVFTFVGELCEENSPHHSCYASVIEVQRNPPQYNCNFTAAAITCTDSCHSFMTYIDQHYGCCIKVLMDSLELYKPSYALALDEMWGKCKLTKPATCPH